MVAPDPIDAPFFTSVRSTFQSLAVCSSPAGVVARGYESLMNVTPWPMKTWSSIVTPSQMNVWLEILQRRPTDRVLLNLDEGADLRLVADLAAVQVDELRELDVLPELDVGSDADVVVRHVLARCRREGAAKLTGVQPRQQAPLPEITARGVARRILMSVQSERRPRVAEVEPHHLVERRPAAPGHLPQPGDARLGVEHAPAVPRLVLLDLVGERRPRSDERHLAAQDVPELRQLVEARLAQEPPDRRDPRVVGHLEHAVVAAVLARLSARLDEPAHVLVMERVIRVRVHRPELQHRERLRILTDADLPEEDRARRRQLHERRDDQKRRRQHQEQSIRLPTMSRPRLIGAAGERSSRGSQRDEQRVDRLGTLLRVLRRRRMHVDADGDAGHRRRRPVASRARRAPDPPVPGSRAHRTRRPPAESGRSPGLARTSRRRRCRA